MRDLLIILCCIGIGAIAAVVYNRSYINPDVNVNSKTVTLQCAVVREVKR